MAQEDWDSDIFFSIDDDTFVILDADSLKIRMEQILVKKDGSNMTTNVIKFSDENAVKKAIEVLESALYKRKKYE